MRFLQGVAGPILMLGHKIIESFALCLAAVLLKDSRQMLYVVAKLYVYPQIVFIDFAKLGSATVRLLFESQSIQDCTKHLELFALDIPGDGGAGEWLLKKTIQYNY